MITVQYKSGTSSELIQLPDNMKLTEHFRLVELANNLGDPKQAQFIISDNSRDVLDMFEIFRIKYGSPINPTSGHRQPDFNKKVGGSSNSLHLQSCAMDFVDKAKKDPLWMFSSFIAALNYTGMVGAINLYREGNYNRYHIEGRSDIYLGYTRPHIRIYTTKAQYNTVKSLYQDLGIMVDYHGK